MSELSGRVAIVTGGAAGLGRGIVERFVAAGAQVVAADIDEIAFGPGVAFRKTDVANPDEVRDLVAYTVETFGGLHVMVNNAGVSGTMHASFLDEDFEDFNRVMAVNVLGVMAGTQQAARHMAANGGGSIVNITSIGGITAGRSVISYRASKAAVIHMSKSVAIDLAEHGVRVNCIAPGNIPTNLLASSMDDDANPFRVVMDMTRPLKKTGTPSDVAEAALYLAGDHSAYVTGAVLPVDGGSSAGFPLKMTDLLRAAAADATVG